MAGKWRKTTLGQLTDFLSGGTPSKDVPEYWSGSVPWASAKDMKRFRLDDTEDHVTAGGIANGTKLVPAGTVLLLARGMTLLNDLPICVTGRPMTFNQDVKALRPKPGVRNDFLPYLLLGNKERLLSLVDLAGHGTGRLNSDELRALDVVLPPESEQCAIAHILATLDDKIDLNRGTNEILETIARAIFKSWFVDFDPVRAKSEGQPEGWTVSSLGEICELAYGKALKAEDRRPGSVPVFGSNGQVGWHDASLVQGPGVVVGRKGNPGVVTWVGCDFFPIDTTFYVVPRGQASLCYLFHLIESLDLPLLGADSAVPGLNRNMAYMSEVLLPPLKVQRAFEGLVQSLWRMEHLRESESRSLAAVRDALLPKLLSGELRIRDAEKVVEAHV